MAIDLEWNGLHCTCGAGPVAEHEPGCAVTIIDELTAALHKANGFFKRYGFPVAAKAEVAEIRATLTKIRRGNMA